jgi:PRC-barrel domain
LPNKKNPANLPFPHFPHLNLRPSYLGRLDRNAQEEFMPRYGTLGDYRFSDAADAASDIRGAKIYGPNHQKLGEIDDVIFDHATGGIVYVIIDTGGWLTSRKFILPPQQLRPSTLHQHDFQVSLSEKEIEAFPPYDHTAIASEEKWADYERRYRSHWVDGPIMHREGTDRNITPTTKQQVGAGSGTIPSAAEEDTGEPITSPVTDAEMELSPAGPTLRWTTFEDKLRQRREEVLESSIKALERAETASQPERSERRKAG